MHYICKWKRRCITYTSTGDVNYQQYIFCCELIFVPKRNRPILFLELWHRESPATFIAYICYIYTLLYVQINSPYIPIKGVWADSLIQSQAFGRASFRSNVSVSRSYIIGTPTKYYILLFVFTCNRNYINKLHTKKKMIMNINYLNNKKESCIETHSFKENKTI